ncbi:MAG: hypothetical protein F6K47_18795, partial [Symploca sp. SIO2E6]|nr:hypothetical protein [Symploca sp. SIO2E6]
PNDPGNVEARISLFDNDGNLLASSIGRASTLLGAGGSNNTNDPYLSFTFREAGTYFLKVTRDVDIDDVINDSPNAAIPTPGTYTLQVSLGNPNFAGNVVNTANTSTASGLFAQTEGAGIAGNINLNTPQLTIADQGMISAATAGTGSAGNISIADADSVVLNQGSISTAVESGAIVSVTAPRSNITIEANQLNVSDDSSIISSTAGKGNAGEIEITASDRLSLDNSRISSEVTSTGIGTGGNISLNTDNFSVTSNATISSATAGRGDAGQVEITASDRLSLDNSRISSAVTSTGIGTGGNISLNTDNFSVT